MHALRCHFLVSNITWNNFNLVDEAKIRIEIGYSRFYLLTENYVFSMQLFWADIFLAPKFMIETIM